VQKKAINKIFKHSFRKKLSIQFSLDGFSFCVSNIDTEEIQNFSSFSFDKKVSSPEILLNEITSQLDGNAVISQDFEEITVIHQNELSTLVPTALFKENQLNAYLSYNIKTLASDFIAFDNLAHIDAKNVYIPYVNINNYLFQKFGEFEYKHHATVLIDKLILQTKNNKEKQCFAFVSEDTFDMVVIENSKLLFHNTFSHKTKEDFLYYLLFTCEQLALNPEEFPLTLLGQITKESELYILAYEYIRNISFLDTEITFFDSEDHLPNYAYYLILP